MITPFEPQHRAAVVDNLGRSLLAVDAASGLLRLEAIDVLDGTPVIDVKPYYASTDAVPDASRPDKG